MRERSRLTRAVQDILQEVAFRKLSAAVEMGYSVNRTSEEGKDRQVREGGSVWELRARHSLADLAVDHAGAASGWILAYNEAAHGGTAAHSLLANLGHRNSSSHRLSSHPPRNSTARAHPPFGTWLKPGMCFRRRAKAARTREAPERTGPGVGAT